MKNAKPMKGKMPVMPQGYKNGGMVKKMADGGMVRSKPMQGDKTCGTGVRSQQDYKK